MRKILFILFAITMVSGSALADDSSHTSKDPKKQEMMKKWMEYATPTAQHKIFENMTGNWKFTSKFWETADSKPHESTGTSKMKLILGGRFLEHQTKGKAMGMPFEGLGITGYDNLKGKYDTVWLDSMGTGMMHGTGTFDSKSQTLTDTGEYSCPESETKSREYRSEWKIIDKNNHVYAMWGAGTDGKEFKQMELVFKRAK
jgi:hypothetical protein